MHPAPSIILFTTFSGLGFGLLFWLGLGQPPVTGVIAFAFFALAYLMAVGGLVASTLHLGNPQRALRAFTQWKTSWLSREGWAAVAALLVMAGFGAGLVFLGARFTLIGYLGAALSLLTVYATSMIYTQLKTVPRWNQPLTPVHFLLYALAGGALLSGQIRMAPVLLLLAGAAQVAHWMRGDKALAQSGTTLATATGLKGKSLRMFEPPHTGSNYLLREMVYRIARKHAQVLRVIAIALGSILPALILLALPVGHLLALVAVLSHLVGVLAARWLFFAEAEHVVGLYYGAG